MTHWVPEVWLAELDTCRASDCMGMNSADEVWAPCGNIATSLAANTAAAAFQSMPSKKTSSKVVLGYSSECRAKCEKTCVQNPADVSTVIGVCGCTDCGRDVQASREV